MESSGQSIVDYVLGAFKSRLREKIGVDGRRLVMPSAKAKKMLDFSILRWIRHHGKRRT